MASRGDSETGRLKENIEGQLKRLLTQLQDLEEMRADLDADEYATAKQETIDQMKEFEQSLSRMLSGNMSLVDQIGSVQLAIQSAIRSVTSSSENASFFANKQNGALRSRLAALDSDLKLGRITADAHLTQAGEILKMLEKLGEELNLREKELLKQYTKNMDGYTVASSEIKGTQVMAVAAKQIGDSAK